MPQRDYADLDAIDLALAIRRGDLGAREAVAASFAAMDKVNPAVNAIILRMEAEAEQQLADLAKRPDRDRLPLAGVPVLLKDDCPFYAGTPHQLGSRLAVGLKVDIDSEIVRRYKQAGLIIVGKTNLPELSCNVATEPVLNGITRNPWNTDRGVGGSGGGAAAAVAARIVPLAYGNDGAGSIRIPASSTGLFGLRPSRGRTPCGPEYSELWSGLVIEHGMSRSVRDSALLLDLTDGPEPGAVYAAPAKTGPYLAAAGSDPRPLKIALMPTPFLDVTVAADCSAALNDAAELCRKLGHQVIEARPEIDGARLSDHFKKYIAAHMAEEVFGLAEYMGRPVDPDHVERANIGLARWGRTLSASDVLQARGAFAEASRSFGRFFLEYDLILSPTMPAPPLVHGSLDANQDDFHLFIDKVMAHAAFTHPANAAGLPAMSVPLFWSGENLPIGVQFMAPYGDEATLFQLAGQLERARSWHDRKPGICA